MPTGFNDNNTWEFLRAIYQQGEDHTATFALHTTALANLKQQLIDDKVELHEKIEDAEFNIISTLSGIGQVWSAADYRTLINSNESADIQSVIDYNIALDKTSLN